MADQRGKNATRSRTAPAKKRLATNRPAKKRAAMAAARSRKPRLLSGGNPQIPKGDGPGPVRTFIAAVPGWKRDACRKLDALIVGTIPDVKKAVKWNSPFYGIEGRGWFLSFHVFANYVKVAFFRGAELEPPLPVTSKDRFTRYAHIHEGEVLDEALWAAWLRQAAALPGWET